MIRVFKYCLFKECLATYSDCLNIGIADEFLETFDVLALNLAQYLEDGLY